MAKTRKKKTKNPEMVLLLTTTAVGLIMIGLGYMIGYASSFNQMQMQAQPIPNCNTTTLKFINSTTEMGTILPVLGKCKIVLYGGVSAEKVLISFNITKFANATP